MTNANDNQRYREFQVGDTVRVKIDLSYFSTAGQEMVIIERAMKDDTAVFKTNKPCSIHGEFYNAFELDYLK